MTECKKQLISSVQYLEFFAILFAAMTVGVFLWSVGSHYNVYWSAGAALVFGGILFSLLIYFAMYNHI
jgi:hypothetical protein